MDTVLRSHADAIVNSTMQAVDGLIITGPTGTNVNDVAVALLRGN